MDGFVSRTPQGRHAADFWRRPAAGDPRPPEIVAAARCWRWKAIYFDEGLRRYGSILRTAHGITVLLDDAGVEIERIAGDRRIVNGLTVSFPNHRVLIGPRITERMVDGMAEQRFAPLTPPSCARAGDLVPGLQARPEIMAEVFSARPQPSTVATSPDRGLTRPASDRISHNFPSPNPRSRATCGVVFVKSADPP
jgi:hypothetical protein